MSLSLSTSLSLTLSDVISSVSSRDLERDASTAGVSELRERGRFGESAGNSASLSASHSGLKMYEIDAFIQRHEPISPGLSE